MTDIAPNWAQLCTKPGVNTEQVPNCHSGQVLLQRVKPRRKLLFCNNHVCAIKRRTVMFFPTSQQHIAGFPLAAVRAEKCRQNDATVPILSFASV